MILLIFTADVQVVLTSDEYRVIESDGPQEVCVEVEPDNVLQRDLVVTLNTRELTAEGITHHPQPIT